MGIANCSVCKRIFEKRLVDKCPECVEQEQDDFRKIYRILQESRNQGGITLDELSFQSGVSSEVIEDYYFAGQLGTAATLLKFQCSSCGLIVGELTRRGRYCMNCSDSFSNQAGIEVKTIQQINQENKQKKEKEELLSLLKQPKNQKNQKSTRGRRSGFIRR